METLMLSNKIKDCSRALCNENVCFLFHVRIHSYNEITMNAKFHFN